MKFTTKLLSGAALAVALMNTANASLVDWTVSNPNVVQLTFTYDTATSSFSNGILTDYNAKWFADNADVQVSQATSTQLNMQNGIYTKFFTSSTPLDLGVIDQSVSGSYDGVVGIFAVTFTSKAHPEASATAVPEPEAYAMMLAGLGLVGFAARRKLAV